MLLYGVGGHARVVLDALDDLGVEVRGIFDDGEAPDHFFGRPVLGKYNASAVIDDLILLTIGDNQARRKVFGFVKHGYGSVVARTALVSSGSTVGSGSMILQHAVVQASSEIGNQVIVNTASQIDHNCVIGDFAHIAPGVVLCGHVVVGEGTLVGAGAVVIPRIRIGKWCTIGAGSVVIRDVPDFTTVAGNPAKKINP